MKRLSLAAVSVLFAILVILVIGRGGGRDAEETAQTSPKSAPKSHRPARSVAAAAERLRKLLGEKPPEMSFLAIEAAVKTLSEEELQALIGEVWPRGVEGYAGWVRCALFAEWGRRDPEGALAFLADPPPLPEPMRNWSWSHEERQHLFSVFRGWGEVNPEAALGRLSMWQLEWITPWHEAASREVLRELARRNGLQAWDKVPVEWGRGGALQGLFRGLEDPQERLTAVNRWLPEKDERQGLMAVGLGYRLGPKSLEKEKFRAHNVRASSDYFFGAAIALGQLDLVMAVDWVRETSATAKDRMLSAFLWRWAAEFPEKAQAELQAGRYSTDDLYIGLIRGNPQRAPELITRIKDPAKRDLVFALGIRWGPRPAGPIWGYFPTAHEPPARPDIGADYHALKRAIAMAGFEASVASEFQSELNSKYSGYRRAVGLRK